MKLSINMNIDEPDDGLWNQNKANMLRAVIRNINGMKVAVFRPQGQFECFKVDFCENNLSLLYLLEHKNELVDEFYNILEIFLHNGVVPRIQMNKKMLEVKNREDISLLSEGFL